MNAATDNATVTFEAGISYFCRSACDSDCVWHFTIIRRTASSVWVLVDGKECRRGPASRQPRNGWHFWTIDSTPAPRGAQPGGKGR
jgi:hypothetical protein